MEVKMHAPSALAVADYIIAERSGFTPMQVNKLAYISHGWTLAILGRALFKDRIEAWKYGPVVPVIYHALAGYGGDIVDNLYYCKTPRDDEKMNDRKKLFEDAIPSEMREIIDRVLREYGHFTGGQLSTLTHGKGSPWARCYKENQLFTPIPDAEIRRHYEELNARAGTA